MSLERNLTLAWIGRFYAPEFDQMMLPGQIYKRAVIIQHDPPDHSWQKREYFRQAYGPMILKPDYREFAKAMTRKWGSVKMSDEGAGR